MCGDAFIRFRFHGRDMLFLLYLRTPDTLSFEITGELTSRLSWTSCSWLAGRELDRTWSGAAQVQLTLTEPAGFFAQWLIEPPAHNHPGP